MQKINFENKPSTNSPINADNLNLLQDNVENTINEVDNKLPSIVAFNKITGLNLNAGNTYQLNLPANTLFVDPLVASNGSTESGGQFVVPGESYSRIVNNDNESGQNGIWISCDANGLITISNYRHCGSVVTGFRIWYINI